MKTKIPRSHIDIAAEVAAAVRIGLPVFVRPMDKNATMDGLRAASTGVTLHASLDRGQMWTWGRTNGKNWCIIVC